MPWRSELSGRIAGALAGNLALAAVAWATGAVTWSGAAAGVAYGVLIWVGLDWRGYALYLAFVVLGSAFTRLGYQDKVGRGVAQEHRGARTWRNATANCLVGAVCATAAAATGARVWTWAFVGSMAAALADTTESELGVLAGRRAYRPLGWQEVPPGTEGAVSPAGTLLGLLAAAALAALAAALGLTSWRAVPWLATAGLLATLLESLAGSARPLSNELLNGLTTLAGAVLAGWAGTRVVG